MAGETRKVTQSEAELIGQIAAEALGHPLTGPPRFVGSGAVNRVFAICADSKNLAVRICEEWRGLSHYRKEAWCLQKTASAGIPGPQTLEMGMFGTTPYMVQTLVSGISGETAPPDRHTGLWQELGRYAKLIHSLPVKGFGENLADAEQGLFSDSHSPTWHDFVEYNLSSLTDTDALLELCVYTAEQRPQIIKIFEALQGRAFPFGLCHHDLDPRNTILSPDGEVMLLDWGSASVNIVPHCDLMAILRSHGPYHEHVSAFLKGYGLSPAEFEILIPQIKQLRLLQSFDLVRWAIDRRPEVLPNCVEGAQQALQSCLT